MSELKPKMADSYKAAKRSIAESISSTQLSPSVTLGNLYTPRQIEAMAEGALIIGKSIRDIERLAHATYVRQRIGK